MVWVWWTSSLILGMTQPHSGEAVYPSSLTSFTHLRALSTSSAWVPGGGSGLPSSAVPNARSLECRLDELSFLVVGFEVIDELFPGWFESLHQHAQLVVVLSGPEHGQRSHQPPLDPGAVQPDQVAFDVIVTVSAGLMQFLPFLRGQECPWIQSGLRYDLRALMRLRRDVERAMAVDAARVAEHRHHGAKGLHRLHLLTHRNRAGRAARADRSGRSWGRGRGDSGNPHRAECKGVECRPNEGAAPALPLIAKTSGSKVYRATSLAAVEDLRIYGWAPECDRRAPLGRSCVVASPCPGGHA